jgi:biotin/methionine sulfoxide reductase
MQAPRKSDSRLCPIPGGRGSGVQEFIHCAHWGAFRAQVDQGKLVGVRPFEHDEHPSPMLAAIPDAVYSRNRIASPMVRSGWLTKREASDRSRRGLDEFVPVSWDIALDLVASELTRVRAAYGNASIYGGSYGWASAGRVHHAQTSLRRLLNSAGGYTRHVTTYSIGAGYVILPHVFGGDEACTGRGTCFQSIAESTELIVSFGGISPKNMQVEAGGVGNHAGVGWLKRIRDRAARIVSFSPVRTDMPDFLDAEWHSLRPNSDVAVMLGLAHTLITEDLHDKEFLSRCCVGSEGFLPYVLGETDGQPKSADWAAAIAEVDPGVIRGLAREMAVRRTFIMVSWSLQRADHGEQPFWMAAALAAVLGQIGLPGGGVGFGYGSEAAIGFPGSDVAGPSMSQGKLAIDSFIPCARIADMLLNAGREFDYDGRRLTYPDIRLIYWTGGNPFHHHQDLNRLRLAWQKPETIIVSDPWWTAMARRADVVLPATTTLERNDIAVSSRDPYIVAMQQAISPVAQARNDFDICAEISERLGCNAAYAEGRDADAWIEHIYETARALARSRNGFEMPPFDEFWATGWTRLPVRSRPTDYLSEFRRDPQSNKLKTPSGKIEIFSEKIASFGYADCPGHPMWLEPAEWLGAKKAARFPLHLISPQPSARLHGQMDHASVSQRAKIGGREPITLNPVDAKVRGIGSGDVVRIYNDRGQCLAGARISDEVRPGVVAMATGAWYDPDDPIAASPLERSGNVNVLTLDKGSSSLGQGCSAHTCLVDVERYLGEPPAVRAYDAP